MELILSSVNRKQRLNVSPRRRVGNDRSKISASNGRLSSGSKASGVARPTRSDSRFVDLVARNQRARKPATSTPISETSHRMALRLDVKRTIDRERRPVRFVVQELTRNQRMNIGDAKGVGLSDVLRELARTCSLQGYGDLNLLSRERREVV